MEKKLMTIKEVAEMCNKKEYQIRYAISTGKISIIRLNWEIFIPVENIPMKWLPRS